MRMKKKQIFRSTASSKTILREIERKKNEKKKNFSASLFIAHRSSLHGIRRYFSVFLQQKSLTTDFICALFFSQNCSIVAWQRRRGRKIQNSFDARSNASTSSFCCLQFRKNSHPPPQQPMSRRRQTFSASFCLKIRHPDRINSLILFLFLFFLFPTFNLDIIWVTTRH